MRTEVHTHSKKALGTWKVLTSWASATTGFVALVAPLDIFVLGFGGAASGVVFTRGRWGSFDLEGPVTVSGSGEEYISIPG